MAHSAALAQQSTPSAAQSWTFEPSVGVSQLFTDNYRTQTEKKSDSVTELSAAARLAGHRGALRGFVDYSLSGSAYARHSEENDVRHFLASALTAELAEGAVFLDSRASYSRQATSAFASPSTSSSLVNDNGRDVGTLFFSPSLRGRLGGAVRYDVRASHEVTRAKGVVEGDVDNSAAQAHLDGGVSGGRLGWSADGTHLVTDYAAGRRTFDTRVFAGLNYLVMRDLRVGITGGRERTDIASVEAQSYNTAGISVEWTPTERTLLAANVDKRFFGTGHALRFSHRTPLTVWTLSSTRDISTNNAQGLAGFGSAYDLFFRQFASAEPDTAKRDLLVRNYLQGNNIDPNSVVVGGFLASAVTLQNTQSASVALVGVRNTVRFQATSSRSERADAVSTSFDDLSTTESVRQRGMLVDWSLRLTPLSTVTVGASYQRTRGDQALQTSTLKSLTASWASTLGPRSTLSAGARFSDYSSPIEPYEESALFAAFRYAF